MPLLADDAVVAIHDTGYWSKAFLDAHPSPEARADPLWRPGPVRRSGPLGKDEHYLHPNAVDERRFVEWIDEAYRGQFSMVHFHTLRYLRNGLTVLQRDRTNRTTVWRR